MKNNTRLELMDTSGLEDHPLLAAFNSINENAGPMYWSDNYFKTHFMERNRLDGRMPIHQTREYAKAFLNWYVSGKGAGKLLDIWIGLVGGMLVPTTAICHEPLLIDSMFRGKIGENETIKLDPLEPVNKLTDFIYTNEGTPFSSCEAKTWYYRVYDMLDSTQSNLSNAVAESTISAINYLSYIALSLLKVLVKEASKISHYITKNITNEFNDFWHRTNVIIRTRTPPPHKFAIQQFERVFQKVSPNCIKILTFVVATYVYSDSLNKAEIRKVLRTACLDYLDLYGMGCLYWLQKAQESCSTTAEALMDCMATSANRETTQALRHVLKNYANPACNLQQYTWRWARLFVDQTFKDISTSKNPEYAATLAACACKCDTNSPIWKILQFRDEQLKNKAIRTARLILVALNNGLQRRLLESSKKL